VHFAGSSFLKGTLQLLQAWLSRPDAPQAELLVTRRAAHRHGAQDLDYWAGLGAQPVTHFRGLAVAKASAHRGVTLVPHLDEGAFQQLAAQADFFVCPSLAEGFGHYLVAGMARGKPVIATDAAPMRELLQADAGLLVPLAAGRASASAREFMPFRRYLEGRFGARVVFPCVRGLRDVIEQALALPLAARLALGAAGRARYLANAAHFQAAVGRLVAAVQGGGEGVQAGGESGARLKRGWEHGGHGDEASGESDAKRVVSGLCTGFIFLPPPSRLYSTDLSSFVSTLPLPEAHCSRAASAAACTPALARCWQKM
jgi:hypothetical protein